MSHCNAPNFTHTSEDCTCSCDSCTVTVRLDVARRLKLVEAHIDNQKTGKVDPNLQESMNKAVDEALDKKGAKG